MTIHRNGQDIGLTSEELLSAYEEYLETSGIFAAMNWTYEDIEEAMADEGIPVTDDLVKRVAACVEDQLLDCENGNLIIRVGIASVLTDLEKEDCPAKRAD